MRVLHVLLACLLLPTLASAQWKEANDATWQPSLKLASELNATAGVGDLALDPAFYPSLAGWERFDFNDANSKEDRGLRIVPKPCGLFCTHFLVFGRHKHGSTWDVVISEITSTGNVVASFGVGGKLQVATPLEWVSDVAVDASSTHFYFSGWMKEGGAPDNDFGVTCIDASGVPCALFGTAGTVLKAFDLGTNKDDKALRIIYRAAAGTDPARLLVGGIATAGTPAAPSTRLGVVAIDPVTGGTQTSFGSAGKVVLQVGEVADLAYVELYDMALSASSMPGGERLYLAGSFQRAPLANNDIDGFLMAIDPHDGSPATSFDGGIISVHNDIGLAGHQLDAVNAIQVLPDGKVAMAGRSVDTNLDEQLLLARATAMDGLDPSFCGGGVCAHILDAGVYVDSASIGVRPITHDLVVAISESRSTGVPGAPHDRLQLMEQYSASGITLHGRQEMEYPTNANEAPEAGVAGLFVGSDITGGYALMIGTTRWSLIASDFDITVVRTIATDEIFASGFGSVDVE